MLAELRQRMLISPRTLVDMMNFTDLNEEARRVILANIKDADVKARRARQRPQERADEPVTDEVDEPDTEEPGGGRPGLSANYFDDVILPPHPGRRRDGEVFFVTQPRRPGHLKQKFAKKPENSGIRGKNLPGRAEDSGIRGKICPKERKTRAFGQKICREERKSRVSGQNLPKLARRFSK